MLIYSIDLNNRNIMWGIRSFKKSNTDTIYEYLGRPQKIKLYLPSGIQAEIVKPVTVSEDLLRDTICLGDFGHAINVGTSVTPKFHAPFEYCAPELLHDKDLGLASDVWSYMCLFLELFLGVRLFYGNG